jgi:hypothetical protein
LFAIYFEILKSREYFKMERVDWELFVTRLATELAELQSGHSRLSGGGGWSSFLSQNGVWELLIGTGRDEERVGQLTAMIRSAGHLTLIDQIDTALDKQFPSIEMPLSEQTLRLRIKNSIGGNINSVGPDLSVEMMADAIDCSLSRMKRRVMRAAFNDVYATTTTVVSTIPVVTNESIAIVVPEASETSETTIPPEDNAEEMPSNNECVIV